MSSFRDRVVALTRLPLCSFDEPQFKFQAFNRTPDQVFGSRVCHVRGLPSSRTRWMRWMTQDTPRLHGYAHTAPAPAPAPAGRPAVRDAADGRQTVLGGGGPRASAASVRPQHALTLKPLALPGLSRPGHNTHRSARARRHVQASTIFVPHPFVCRNADCALLSLPVHPGRRCRRLARLANESPEHAARRPVGLSSQPQVLRRPLTSPAQRTRRPQASQDRSQCGVVVPKSLPSPSFTV